MATGGRALIKSTTKTTRMSEDAKPLEQRIRERAYEIYLQRGGGDGAELEDWLQAEEELRGPEPDLEAD